MTEYMTVEEFHQYQATGRMPKRHRQQTRSSVLAQVAAVDPELAGKAAVHPQSNDRPGPALTISEKAFQSLVEQAARAAGWLVYHTFSSRRSEPGFPDLVCINPAHGKLIFAELKTAKGRLSKAQVEWTSALEWAGQEVYVWRPADWDDIDAVLTGRAG